MSDWKHVAKVATDISKETDRLDILVNNAARGIMTYQLTDYGVDRHMAVNHMGHVILTSHLLPLLKKTADSGSKVHIVNTASNAHESVPKDCQFKSIDDLNKDLGPMPQYGRAKLTAILYSKYLNRHVTKEHPNLLANAIHPGVVKTKMSEEDIFEPYPLAGYLMSGGLTPFKKDQFEGALSTLYAATVTGKSGKVRRIVWSKESDRCTDVYLVYMPTSNLRARFRSRQQRGVVRRSDEVDPRDHQREDEGGRQGLSTERLLGYTL